MLEIKNLNSLHTRQISRIRYVFIVLFFLNQILKYVYIVYQINKINRNLSAILTKTETFKLILLGIFPVQIIDDVTIMLIKKKRATIILE